MWIVGVILTLNMSMKLLGLTHSAVYPFSWDFYTNSRDLQYAESILTHLWLYPKTHISVFSVISTCQSQLCTNTQVLLPASNLRFVGILLESDREQITGYQYGPPSGYARICKRLFANISIISNTAPMLQ